MANSLPFSITPDAEEFLRSRINQMPQEAQPVLMMTKSQSDGLNPPQWSYKGESFVVGYFDSLEKPKAELVESELFGRRISITADALKHLSGRTLGLLRVEAQYGLMKNTRYVMVTDLPDQAVNGDGISEKARRGFSIGALTVLGGFTGMGIFWIIYGTIAGVILRFPVDKFFGSNVIFPIFVTGWILGAIISFFFFRFVYKANGRTRFKQEQRERKYFGYGGPGADLNWRIFLGIPASLMAILMLAFAPFAHTDAQRAYGTVILLMIVLGGSLYFSDKMPRKLVFRLGISGWVITFIVGYLFFKIRGP